MIYTNKAQFKPIIILLSVLFVPSISALIVCCFLIPSIPIYCILFSFLIIYCLSIFAIKKESNSHRNFIKIGENSLIIKFDNFSADDNENEIMFNDIIQIDYYKINSVISWIGLLSMQCPKIAFLKYTCDNKVIQKPIGYFEKVDIERMCFTHSIKLIVH